MKKIEIVYKNINELIPYENNPRINDKAISYVANSIKQFGFKNPVIIDNENVIIAGHTRLKACKQLGIKEIPCIYADDLNDEEVKAFRLADNKVSEIAEWDYTKLDLEIESILNIDMLDFGFEDIFKMDIPNIIEDNYDTTDTMEIQVNNGDIFKLGNHFVMCGDSTINNNIQKLLNGKDYDTIIFDPPYEITELYNNIPINTGASLLNFYDYKRFAIQAIKAVEQGYTPQYEFIWDCCQSWYNINRPLARHKCCAVYKDDPYWNYDKAIISDGKERKHQKGTNSRGNYNYEPLDGAVHLRTVESFPNTALKDNNGYGKPVQWISALLQGVDASVVLDMFGGSGTTLIYCEQLGITSYTIELNSEYVSNIINRWEQLTGEKHVKV